MPFIRVCHHIFHDMRVLNTFAWAIVGLILSKRPHSSHWLPFRPGLTQAASKERQFLRWLHNDKIDPMKIYLPLVHEVLKDWSQATLYLALDTTMLWDKFVVVRVALVYSGRAIPLGWVVFPSSSATVAVVTYQRMLAQIAAQLPLDATVVLLADRGFGHVALMKICKQLGWHFRIRLKSDTWIYQQNGKQRQIHQLVPPLGEAHCYENIRVTKKRYGPLCLVMAHVKTPNGTEKWAILSDEPVGRTTFDEYGLRFCIEENFLDDKSNGFNLEDSQLRDSMAISRLCLILAVATLYLVSTGMAVDTLGFRSQVDTHWRRGLSYLQIGWRWCTHAIWNNKWLQAFLWLPPNPDPEPAIASWKQFFRPMYELHSLKRF